MNKKAVVFSWTLVLLSIIVLVYALVEFNGKYNKFERHPIGEKQFNLIKVYQEADKILFFIDQSAKYAAYKTIYELAEKGIDFKNIENDFEIIFNNNLNDYIILYPGHTIPQNNYDTAINEKTEILGFAVKNIELEAVKKNETIIIGEKKESTTNNKILEYSIKPNFKVNLDFDLTTFDKIKQQSQELIDKCSTETNIESCIDGNIILFNKNSEIEWSKVEGSDRNFKFNVNTHKILFPFEEEVVIKFALHFPEP